MQHKAMKLMASKLAVAGIIEGNFSEEGLAAMSECEDMTTLMAKELMLGIKDSVEDLAATFKRMALLKPQSAAWSIFAETPTERDNATLTAPVDQSAGVEFSFGLPEAAAQPAPSAVSFSPEGLRLTQGKRKKPEISEEQIPLFKIA